jgi:putative flippase GtrA
LKSWKEFLHFDVVGVIGFAVDASTLAIMLMAGAGVLWSRVVSYVAAASCT